MKAPAKFNTAASRTATLGFSARVAIDVAIALAASWNPFVTSNPSAVTTTRASTRSLASMSACVPRRAVARTAVHGPVTLTPNWPEKQAYKVEKDFAAWRAANP